MISLTRMPQSRPRDVRSRAPTAALADLATLVRLQGRFEEAREIFLRLLETVPNARTLASLVAPMSCQVLHDFSPRHESAPIGASRMRIDGR